MSRESVVSGQKIKVIFIFSIIQDIPYAKLCLSRDCCCPLSCIWQVHRSLASKGGSSSNEPNDKALAC